MHQKLEGAGKEFGHLKWEPRKRIEGPPNAHGRLYRIGPAQVQSHQLRWLSRILWGGMLPLVIFQSPLAQ